jgi:hypothetical protein
MYFSFSIFNPVKNEALKAPPVPIRPTIKPDIPPPRTSDFGFAGKASLGLRRKIAEISIKNTPNMNLRRVCDRLSTREAPIKLRKKLGIPNSSKILLSKAFLKNAILLIFPKK